MGCGGGLERPDGFGGFGLLGGADFRFMGAFGGTFFAGGAFLAHGGGDESDDSSGSFGFGFEGALGGPFFVGGFLFLTQEGVVSFCSGGHFFFGLRDDLAAGLGGDSHK